MFQGIRKFVEDRKENYRANLKKLEESEKLSRQKRLTIRETQRSEGEIKRLKKEIEAKEKEKLTVKEVKGVKREEILKESIKGMKDENEEDDFKEEMKEDLKGKVSIYEKETIEKYKKLSKVKERMRETEAVNIKKDKEKKSIRNQKT